MIKILEHGLYISALERVMKLILSSYVLLLFITQNVSIVTPLYVSFETCYEVDIMQLYSSSIHKYNI